MYRSKSAVFGLTLLLATPGVAAAQEDKTAVAKLVEEVIPEEVRTVFENATEIAGFVNGVKGIIDAAGVLGKLLGIGPDEVDIQAEFNKLNEHLEAVKTEIGRQHHAQSSSVRFGKIHAAVDSLMEAMTHQQDAGVYLAHALTSSDEVMRELENALSSPTSEQAYYVDADGNPHYDWRMAVPELMQAIALRLVILQADDPNWTQQAWRVNEVTRYRDWLIAHRDAMVQSIRCDSAYCGQLDPWTGAVCIQWIGACTDTSSGMGFNMDNTSDTGSGGQGIVDGFVRAGIEHKMSLDLVQQMIDHLDGLIAQQP